MTRFDRSRPAARSRGKELDTPVVIPAAFRAPPRAPSIPKAAIRAETDALVAQYLANYTITKLPMVDPSLPRGKPVPLPPPLPAASPKKKPSPGDCPV